MASVRPQSLPQSIFVGRARELEGLRAALTRALEGHGSLVLVSGPPGIGKTRLARELETHAAAEGAGVHWGRCWDGGGAPPYWPWTQILRSHATGEPQKALPADVRGHAYLAELVPELFTEMDRAAPTISHDALESEAGRFYLFDAVTRLLCEAARSRPSVLIIDDLHAADRSSVPLLYFLAQQLDRIPMLVLANCRDLEAELHPEVREFTERLSRHAGSVKLTGLTRPETRVLAESVLGSAPSEEMLAAVQSATDGNPLFLTDLLNMLRANRDAGSSVSVAELDVRVPQTVRQPILRLFHGLAREHQTLLSLAAVIGSEFDAETLALVSQEEEERIHHGLGAAMSVGLVSRGGPYGRAAFSHSLVRETLLHELSPVDRARLHHSVALALEARFSADLEGNAALLAHHFVQAVPNGTREQAVRYSAIAGNRAMRVFAYEQAAAHYRAALDALGWTAQDAEQRCALVVALGAACRRAGGAEKARPVFSEALAIARRHGLRREFGRAVLGYGGLWETAGMCDEHLVSLLDEALRMLDGEDPSLRARLLGRLAIELCWSPSRQSVPELARESVEIARRLSDPDTLATTLASQHFSLWGPGTLGERTLIAKELLAIAQGDGNPELTALARYWLAADLLESGEIGPADLQIANLERLAEETRQPLHLWDAAILRTTRALLEGRFAEGERLADEAVRLGEAVSPPHARLYRLTHLVFWRSEEQRLEEIESELRTIGTRYPQLSGLQLLITYLDAELGGESAARHALDHLAAGAFDELPEEATWLSGACLLADVCARVEHAEMAGRLYRRILPYENQNVCTAHGGGSFGSAARALGVLATTLEKWTEAEAHFVEARRANVRMGARPFTAWTELRYAEMLLRRNGRDDAGVAAKLLTSAAVAADGLAMKKLGASAMGLLASLGGSSRTGMHAFSGPQERDEAPASAQNVFRWDGEHWLIVYENETVRFRDAKGFRYLAWMLRHPGFEFRASDLARENAEVEPRSPAGSADGQASSSFERAFLGNAGVALDAKAASEYRRRVGEIKAELADAERSRDEANVSRLRREMDFLMEEIRSATSLGNKSRRSADVAERARKAVTNRIREALRRIEKQHPHLARHLTKAVRTGHYCSYTPITTTSWSCEA